MSSHIEQPSYGDLLDTVRGLQRYARAARQYLPLYLGTNLVELSTDALDLVLRAECVQEDAASALTAVDVETMYQQSIAAENLIDATEYQYGDEARGHINIEEGKE
jgi:hypothetical protein